MSLSFSFHERCGYILLEITGEWELEAFKRIADAISAESKTRGSTYFLVDMRAVTTPRLREIDRYFLGEYVASVLMNLTIAVVARKELITLFFENTAVNRGVGIKIFIEMQDAVQWLRGREHFQ